MFVFRYVLFVILLVALPAMAEVPELEVERAVLVLQPTYTPSQAAAWAGVLYAAGQETGIDPLLLTALAFRESSLRQDVVGSRGEIGALQLHGVSLRHLPRGCDPRELSCNVRGGAAFLQWVRATCGGPWDVWVGAYGLSRCPADGEAASLPSVRRARVLYEQIGGRGWR